MKKILMVPAVIGLLAVPSFALAHSGVGVNTTARVGADNNSPLDIRREDKRVDATTHVTAQSRVDDDNDQVSPTVTVPAGSISLDQAKAIALGVLPDKTINKVETESEHGTLVYSVRFTDSSRVDVQASDGAVVRIESESHHDDDVSGHVETEAETSSDDSDHHATVSAELNSGSGSVHIED